LNASSLISVFIPGNFTFGLSPLPFLFIVLKTRPVFPTFFLFPLLDYNRSQFRRKLFRKLNRIYSASTTSDGGLTNGMIGVKGRAEFGAGNYPHGQKGHSPRRTLGQRLSQFMFTFMFMCVCAVSWILGVWTCLNVSDCQRMCALRFYCLWFDVYNSKGCDWYGFRRLPGHLSPARVSEAEASDFNKFDGFPFATQTQSSIRSKKFRITQDERGGQGCRLLGERNRGRRSND